MPSHQWPVLPAPENKPVWVAALKKKGCILIACGAGGWVVCSFAWLVGGCCGFCGVEASMVSADWASWFG